MFHLLHLEVVSLISLCVLFCSHFSVNCSHHVTTRLSESIRLMYFKLSLICWGLVPKSRWNEVLVLRLVLGLDKSKLIVKTSPKRVQNDVVFYSECPYWNPCVERDESPPQKSPEPRKACYCGNTLDSSFKAIASEHLHGCCEALPGSHGLASSCKAMFLSCKAL